MPVGEDQKQHIELARDIAGAFNRKYETDFFPLPEPLIFGEATRVMSLRDGRKKMSSSDPSDQSRINLTDDADTIAQKIRRAKSDAEVGLDLRARAPAGGGEPADLYAALADRAARGGRGALRRRPRSRTSRPSSPTLAVDKLAPITAEMRRLMAAPDHIDQVLREGAERAEAIATDNLARIYDLVGFLPR